MGGLIIENPVWLKTVVASDTVIPGDTILIRGGTYTGDYAITYSGTAELPIVIKPYNGEHVIIDGSLELRGKYIHVYDIDFTDSSTNRTRPNADETLGVYVVGVGCAVYGCVVSDMHANGLTFMGSGVGEICENMILHNGIFWEDLDGHCHNMYAHNNLGGARLIARNVFSGCLGDYNLQIFSESNAARDFTVEDCTFMQRNTHTGSVGGLFDLIWRRNIQYGGYSQQGRYCYDIQSVNGQIIDNYYIGLSSFTVDQDCTYSWLNLTESGNIVYTGQPASRTGYTVTEAPDVKTWVVIFTKSIRWKGMITIYNKINAVSVNVELTGIAAGSYNLRNCQNPDENIPITWDGSTPITITLNTLTNRQYVGAGTDATTWPTFGTFMIETA